MPQPQQVDTTAQKAPENEFLDLNPPQIEEETPEIEAQPEAPSEDAKAAEVEARSNGWVSKDEWVENHGRLEFKQQLYLELLKRTYRRRFCMSFLARAALFLLV